MLHAKNSRRQRGTQYVRFDSHICDACWACVEACPQGVIGKVDFFFHKHARIEHPEACKGCLRCVKACPSQALTSLIVKRTREPLTPVL